MNTVPIYMSVCINKMFLLFAYVYMSTLFYIRCHCFLFELQVTTAVVVAVIEGLQMIQFPLLGKVLCGS